MNGFGYIDQKNSLREVITRLGGQCDEVRLIGRYGSPRITDKVAPLPASPGTKRAGQFGLLVGRELVLLQADWWSRLAVPTLVAALFALAVGVAVEPTHVPLLGFLGVISALRRIEPLVLDCRISLLDNDSRNSIPQFVVPPNVLELRFL